MERSLLAKRDSNPGCNRIFDSVTMAPVEGRGCVVKGCTTTRFCLMGPCIWSEQPPLAIQRPEKAFNVLAPRREDECIDC
jgi:hypothetical protein